MLHSRFCHLAMWRRIQKFPGKSYQSEDVDLLREEPAGKGAAATCSSGQIPDVAKLVLQSGMAVVNSHGRKYMEYQQQAVRSHSGLWSGSFTPRRNGEFRILKDRFQDSGG